ncbi:DoxX family protein [Moritella dasanensis]|uniref:DoxX family protein n=1 Tax=Moritella dasanensis TaxID=428031 RepID=UPI0002EDA7BB|nr:DoxX family protein [Moritella dasanensis]
MNTFITVIIALLSAFFLFAGSIKLFGWQKMIFEKQLEFFQSYGLNRQIMALIGTVELFGASCIWFQSSVLGLLGAAALLATSLGAIFFHLRFDTWKDGIPAMVTLSLSGLVIFF